ncbi:Flavin-containing monooxygenase [Caenorhabditis elegans]|uniref:Flavin-containing monooxygenase n=1 Tax=Caenorhabditis elegans TaxID=6239 RepID=Q9GYJ1_CAEEL|nr:Flavin-containing monooxygenase [Caenorhabditis elegans]CCD66216.1 Flavin-containing monooxygenase [Caenorhabditis elegans]|eukprot:NP_491510.1 Flavin-containing monooxygenase [Caenorhabditis elegans]
MPKRVCVIGAGAAGLAAAKHSLAQGLEVEVFEQTGNVGGTWVYSKQTGSHSSMYQNMTTNLPKEVMQFRGVPFRNELPSFLTHENVREYLQEFSQGMPIHFNQTVENVERIDDKWKVTTHHGAGIDEHFFDIVFVCNGHYFAPNNPYEESAFEGSFIHSHDYRHSKDYIDKEVIVIGAGPSGIDISLQLSETAKKITLISKKATYPTLPDNITQISQHVKQVVPEGCETDDGTLITADAIIVCTGYFYKYPFLSDNILRVKENNQLVSPIFEHVVHAEYPNSLYFIGLNLVTITFPLFEYQVKMALSFATGRAPIPDRKMLIDYEKNQIEHQKSRGLAVRFYHLLQSEQWEYLARIAKLGNFDEWPYMKTIENITTYLQEKRKSNVIEYKNINFKLSEDGMDYEVVKC